MPHRTVARLISLITLLVLVLGSTSRRAEPTTAAEPRQTAADAQPYFETIELVSANADGENSNGGSGWGPMANRIVRLSNGDLLTTYTTSNGSDATTRSWYLARRDAATGHWQTVTSGGPVRESAQVLRGPHDSVHVMAAPGGLPAESLAADGIHFAATAIPGNWETNPWDYLATAIAPNGDTYVFTSNGAEQPGMQPSAYFSVRDHTWHPFTSKSDYRYNYLFAFPKDSGELAFVATRDVQWKTLGFLQPPSAREYVSNAFKYWHTSDIASIPVRESLLKEELPASPGQNVTVSVADAYTDDQGRLHIIYSFSGPDTVDEWGQEFTGRHMVIQDGKIVNDAALPGNFPDPFLARITQDTQGNFYIFSIYGGNAYILQEDNNDGTAMVPVTVIPMPKYPCNGDSAGSFIATPRAGTPIADYVDGVCDAGPNSTQWVYFRLRLVPANATSVARSPSAHTTVTTFGDFVLRTINAELRRFDELVRTLRRSCARWTG